MLWKLTDTKINFPSCGLFVKTGCKIKLESDGVFTFKPKLHCGTKGRQGHADVHT